MKQVLVTGGSGFIGSHTTLELLKQGYKVVALDNLMNSKIESLNRVEKLADSKVDFFQIDLLDKHSLRELFARFTFDAVIHFAGLKAVGESVEKPLLYYKNNVTGTLNLLEAMSQSDVKRLVFSSSATVYGDPDESPITEKSPLSSVNPYGATKLIIENILRDLYQSDDGWSLSLLRYFNPVGAHESGEIGEDPNGIPNNLMPYVTQVAIGKLDKLNVYGNDYDTPDGTGIRDYIHVVDLALGHLKALEQLRNQTGLFTYNLGTGKGSSVLDVIHAFEEATGCSIPYQFAPRRPGDAAICYADVSKAAEELNWKTERNLVDMCRDAWNWQSKNPNGFATSDSD